MTVTPLEPVFTEKDLAARWGVSIWSVRHLRYTGRLKGRQILPRKWICTQSDVERYETSVAEGQE